ncbi:MAG: response regulator [SAR202 cluster bacterium]|nr:response regulator [SAR202 cluster bacterium]
MTTADVLIIDDESAVRDAVAEDLKREGYNLHFAQNGQEGIQQLRENCPTVILLDLRMPVMDGFEFLESIQLRPQDPYSVIVLTGHGDAGAIKICYESGVTTFIKKPFNLFEIRGVVKNAIAVKQLTNYLDELVKSRTEELEQRMREVTALNQMFQDQLSKNIESEAEHNALIGGLERLIDETEELLRLARNKQSTNDSQPGFANEELGGETLDDLLPPGQDASFG